MLIQPIQPLNAKHFLSQKNGASSQNIQNLLSIGPSKKLNFSNSNQSSSIFWRCIKWVKNHLDLVQLSTMIFLLGSLMTVPISHGTRLINARRNKLSQLDLFTSLRNDIAYVVLGIMTYTLPILFLDDLGRRIAESMAIKDIASGKLHVQSNKDLKDICKYLGALIGLLFGLITNDVGRATIRSNAEKFAGGFLETKEGFLKFCRFNVPKLKAEIKAIKKEEAVPGFVSS